MKPILYAVNETDFSTQGLGALYDCISASVTEERNGMYELHIVYPITGRHYSDIHVSSIIKALPFEGGTNQLFRVYSVDNPINGKCEIRAEHISYQLNYIPVSPFTASGKKAEEIMELFKSHAAESCPFNFSADSTFVKSTYKLEQPDALRALLGGQSGSLLDLFGGEYEFDNYDVKLHVNRGVERDVTLRYGKNITDIRQEENIEKTVTGVYPYYFASKTDEDGNDVYVELDQKVIHSEAAENFPFQRTVTLDLSQEWQEAPSQQELQEKAEAYMDANQIGIPDVNIEVSFIPLWGTEEYKDIAPLERVHLCDTINVEFEPLGISAKAKIVKTVFDVLGERYTAVQLGNTKSTFGKTLAEIEKKEEEEIKQRPTRDNVQDAINHIMELIAGSYGGYKIEYGGETFYIDTPSLATATTVVRVNRNGVFYSQNGYEGPYTSGWGIDGTALFSILTALRVNAERVETGLLTDGVGKNYWNLDTGEFRLSTDSVSVETEGGGVVPLEDVVTGENLDQEAVFNALTNDGAAQGIYLQNGQLYINGTYVSAQSLRVNGHSLAGDDVSSQITPINTDYYSILFKSMRRYPYEIHFDIMFEVLKAVDVSASFVPAICSGLPMPQAANIWNYRTVYWGADVNVGTNRSFGIMHSTSITAYLDPLQDLTKNHFYHVSGVYRPQ